MGPVHGGFHALAGTVHRATGGAFDPTIQPLWRLYADAAARDATPGPAEIAETRERTGWRHLRLDTSEVAFVRPGMALTLNGIAQGYIADRIAGLLCSESFKDLLVDMGEIAALGTRPDGRPWRAGIAEPSGTMVHRLELSDRALATSAPLGTLLDRNGVVGHIIDPRTGAPGAVHRLVAISHSRAALADALSTALCLAGERQIARIRARLSGVRRVVVVDGDGSLKTL